jgi:biotin operon repressor
MNMTPTRRTVLSVLRAAKRKLAKHEIAEMCQPRMNDHAVSARISDLRKMGYDIKKVHAGGKQRFYLYYMAGAQW